MLETLLVVAVVAAALACPVMMWYGNRRGRTLACRPPRREAEPELARLKAERAALDDRIAAARENAAAGRP